MILVCMTTRSPMTRVVKVLWAAAKRKRRSSNIPSPPVTQPNGHADLGLAAAMRKTHSYQWLQNAVEDSPPQAGITTPELNLTISFTFLV